MEKVIIILLITLNLLLFLINFTLMAICYIKKDNIEYKNNILIGFTNLVIGLSLLCFLLQK